MERKSIVAEKSFLFAKRIIKLSKYLQSKKNEFVISKQIMKSGTSIGANIFEAKYAQSEKDFLSKLSIALKEASETKYWIMLIEEEYISRKESESLRKDLDEILKLLVSSTKTVKNKL